MSVDFDNFVFDPSLIFTNKEFSNAFFEFLKKESNTEPMDFIKIIMEDENKTFKEEEALKKTKELVETYLKDNSVKGLNISGKNKKEIMDEYHLSIEKNKWMMSEPYPIVFQKILKSLKDDLTIDTFPRFLRDDLCLKLFQKYWKDTKLFLPKVSYQYPIKNDHFKTPYITEMELLYYKNLLKMDSLDFKLIESKKKHGLVYHTYISKKNYLPFVSFANNTITYQFEAVIKFPIQHVLSSVCNYKLLNEKKDIQNISILHHISNEEYNNSFREYEKKDQNRMGNILEVDIIEALIKKKKWIATHTFEYDKSSESYFSIMRSTEYKDFKDIDYDKMYKGDFKKKNDSHTSEKEFQYSFKVNIYEFKEIDDEKTVIKGLYIKHLSDSEDLHSNLSVKIRGKEDRKYFKEICQSTYDEKGRMMSFLYDKNDLEKDHFGKLLVNTIPEDCKISSLSFSNSLIFQGSLFKSNLKKISDSTLEVVSNFKEGSKFIIKSIMNEKMVIDIKIEKDVYHLCINNQKNDESSQKWMIKDQHLINEKYPNMIVVFYKNVTNKGALLVLEPKDINFKDFYKWKYEKQMIICLSNNLVFDLQAEKVKSGTLIIAWSFKTKSGVKNQQWKILYQ